MTLGWEPSAAQVTHSYSHRLPALELFYRKIFAIKVDPLNLEPLNQAKNIPVSFPSSPIRGPSVQGFLSYEQTNRQTEITTL